MLDPNSRFDLKAAFDQWWGGYKKSQGLDAPENDQTTAVFRELYSPIFAAGVMAYIDHLVEAAYCKPPGAG